MTNKKKNKKKGKAKANAQANVPEQHSSLAIDPKDSAATSNDAPLVEVQNEIMLSVHCGTMLAHANKLKQFLLAAGYSVFLCDQMQTGEDYRDEISLHASQCKAFIPFINAPWCKSRECGYEFKIALRKNLVNNGIPALLPLLLEDFKVYDDYPAVYGILCSTNGIRVDPSALGNATWNSILTALMMHEVPPTSRVRSGPRSAPSAATEKEPSVSIPSPEPVVIEERTPMRDITFFPKHVWSDILFYSDLTTLGRFARVATGFYYPSKRLLGGVVTTFAGTGQVGALDGATQYATFNDICGMAVDPRNGNLYVAEFGNSKIRHICDGSVTTLAGSGATGAQDGPAATASFKNPKGVAVDQNGNVYVADSWNCKIRKISADGIVSTYAGTGTDGCADGPTEKSMFNCPEGIAVDREGSVYVTDSRSNRIRKINPDGVVSTIAGSGERGATDGNCLEATFSHPVGLAINDQGDIFVADSLNHKIRKISQGVVSTVAGKEKGYQDGTVENANFNKPKGIAIDQTDGSLIVADFDNHRIRKIDQKGRVFTMAGAEKGYEDGNAKKAKFTNPCAIAVHAGVVYIAEEKFVRKLSSAAF